MVRKSKYNLSTYFIEENLLFFTSLGKEKKKIAFSILKIQDIDLAIANLNEFLKMDYLNYYSIQISLLNNYEILVFIGFIDFEKKRILNSFNIIREKLSQIKEKIIFLKEESLEKQFFNIGFNNKDSKFSCSKSKDAVIIENGRSTHLLTFSILDLLKLSEKTTFLHDFFNFLKKRELKGSFILNFKKALNGDISLSNYFIELKETDGNETNLNEEINEFFKIPLLKKQKLEKKNLFKLLWRLEISEECLAFNKVSELFNYNEIEKVQDLTELNLKCEKLLKTNKINFHRLNPNLILIKKNILFVLFERVDYELLNKVIANYYDKYQILILVLNRKEYFKLNRLEKINNLNRLKIFNYQEYANTFLNSLLNHLN